MTLTQDVSLLRAVPLFAGLTAEQLRLIAFNAERRAYSNGQYLYREGEAERSAFIVAAGEVTVIRESARGTVDEGRFGIGTILGEMALLAGGKRPASARAIGDADALEISRAMFHRLLEEYPDVAARLHGMVSQRMRALMDDLARVKRRFED